MEIRTGMFDIRVKMDRGSFMVEIYLHPILLFIILFTLAVASCYLLKFAI